MPDKIALEPTSDRGFVATDEVKTDYGSTVRFGESSSAEGPKIWMWTKQPPPPYPGALEQEPGKVHTHMTFNQAIAIRDRLNAMIDITREAWGIEGDSWEPDEEEYEDEE